MQISEALNVLCATIMFSREHRAGSARRVKWRGEMKRRFAESADNAAELTVLHNQQWLLFANDMLC